MKHVREFFGELLGTYILVLFGCGAVGVFVLFDGYKGLLQISLVWGIAVTLAIYATRILSFSHLNPAVSLAMVVSGKMKANKLIVYLTAQFIGAFIAGLSVYLLYAPSITAFEQTNEIIRGTPESIKTAMIFGDYYPFPLATAIVSMPMAIFTEAFGTFLLVLIIFALTDGCNVGRPDDATAPLFIGLTVSSIVCLIAPLTQSSINPARDFGPRMVAWLMGWGDAAFPDHSGGFFFVYILGPLVGAILAALFFTYIYKPFWCQIHCVLDSDTKSDKTG